MDFFNILLKSMHKVYRTCAYMKSFFQATASVLSRLYIVILRLYKIFFFSEIDEETCSYWEKELKILNPADTIENRRSEIRAKWLASAKTNLSAIQRVCDAWKYGKVQTFFKDGIIDVKFVSDFGIPDDIDRLKNSISEVKPAHLGYELSYKYLLIQDIHEIKTLEEMENIEINSFALGRDE